MSEFERTPESMRAELAELYEGIETADKEYAAIPDGDLETSGNLDKVTEIMARAQKLKAEAYQILIALNDLGEIRSKLQQEAEMYLEAGMEPDFNSLLFESFGLDEEYELEPRVQELIDTLQSEVESEE